MKRYRMLAHQPLAIPVADNVAQPFRIYPDQAFPRAAIEPIHTKTVDRMQLGGSHVTCEFETNEADLIRVAHEGMQWIDDVLACFAVSAGVPARRSVPVELIETTLGVEQRDFLAFMFAEPAMSPVVISGDDIQFLRSASAHWRELDTGNRLRRAARRFAQALGEYDALAAFQVAYQGLEALEKPLAIEMKLEPGAEVVKGKCGACGAEFERKRTTLVGVRALVVGDLHDIRTPQREAEWKKLSGLRNDVTHGLKDLSSIEGQADELLPVVMHYLHDGCAHLVHQHQLETSGFGMYRPGPKQYIAFGDYIGENTNLFMPLLRVQDLRWIQRGSRVVPEFAIFNQGGAGGAYWFELSKPLSAATEDDLLPVRWETPQQGVPKKGRKKNKKARKRTAEKRARKKNRKGL